MFRVSNELCLDLGPDALDAAADYGDLSGLRHVLITHTHEDHFYYALADTRALAFPPPEGALNFYLTDKAHDIIDIYRDNPAIMGGKLRALEQKNAVKFHRLDFGCSYDICGMEVVPLRANHYGNMHETGANYLIRLPGGKMLFYAVDTGYFLPETFEALRKYNLDILIIECTYGDSAARGEKPDFHLDFQSCLRVFGELLSGGSINAKTKIYLTHINHKHTAAHADMEHLADNALFPCEITAAYDGLRI